MKTKNSVKGLGPLGRQLVVVLLALAVFSPLGVFADPTPPDRMSYQGYLVDANGNPLAPSQPANYTVVFRIYNAPQGGGAMWSEQQIVTVDKGNFSVLLGEGTIPPGETRPLLSSVFSGNSASDRYIGITVTIGNTTMDIAPRLRLLPNAYSFLSHNAVNLVNSDGNTVLSHGGGQVQVVGTLSAGGFQGNGSLLSGLTASQIGSGTFASDRIPTTLDGSRIINGSLGVGSSSSPSRPLHVNSTVNVVARLDSSSTFGTWLALGNSSTSGRYWQIISSGSGNGEGAGKLLIGNGTSDGSTTVAQTIVSDGKVGIGTSVPAFRMHVVDPGLHTARMHVGSRSANGEAKLISFGDSDYVWVGENIRDDLLEVKGSTIYLNSSRVGIGTSDPTVPLDVRGSSSLNRSYAYYARNGNALNAGFAANVVGAYTIIAEQRVGALEFNAFSDARIKTVIAESNSRNDLNLIRKLKVTDYRAVDTANEGTGIRKGFIAQEVQQVIPEAVVTSTRFVPDVYAIASAIKYDATAKTLSITLGKDHSARENDTIRIIADESELDLKVAAVAGAKTLVLAGCEKEPANVFVYGKQVDDFRSVNYDRIFTTGISAMQELAREVESLKARSAEMEERLAKTEKLERELAELKKLVGRVVASQDAGHDKEVAFIKTSDSSR